MENIRGSLGGKPNFLQDKREKHKMKNLKNKNMNNKEEKMRQAGSVIWEEKEEKDREEWRRRKEKVRRQNMKKRD